MIKQAPKSKHPVRATRVAILGAGSWGTAMAIHLARRGFAVHLWGHRAEHLLEMQQQGCNPFYLPDTPFPKGLIPEPDLQICLKQAEQVILAVPSHAFDEILQRLPAQLQSLAWLTKGLDSQTNVLLSDLVSHKYGQDFPQAVITGPSFAREVAQGLPTALTIAANCTRLQEALIELIHDENLRVYASQDMIGVQIAGAVKNVLAIACGISDGLGYGANARAALITRGLAEMRRLGVELGAQAETFMGLAGLGDLVLTCTDNQSRNRRFGLSLGEGLDTETAQLKIGQVVEGRHNAAQVCALAAQYQVEMPICQQVLAVLSGKTAARTAVMNLMTRPVKEE